MSSFLRSLPDFKGKRRLARLLNKSLIENGRNLFVKGKYGCNYHLPNLKEYLSFDIFVNGIYEKETIDFFIKRVPQNGVILDLGANIGSISIPLCKNRPDIKCVAIEAVPWIYNFLQKNIAENKVGSSIQTLNFALTDVDNQQLPFYSTEDSFGKGSLSPVYTETPITVTTITLSSMLKKANLKRADMIKIDIEGYEYFAFKGGEEFLRKDDAPEILFEFVDWAEEKAHLAPGSAQQLLIDYGYSLYAMSSDGNLSKLNAVQKKDSAMFFATKKNKV